MLIPIEIKSSDTIVREFFKVLSYWKHLTGSLQHGYVIYSGLNDQDWPYGTVLSWQNVDKIFNKGI